MESEEKKKKQEELHSRRDFFRKAAKTALPILGAVALANLPILKASAHESNVEMGCDYNCYSTCRGGCLRGCRSGCKMGCKTTCIHGSM